MLSFDDQMKDDHWTCSLLCRVFVDDLVAMPHIHERGDHSSDIQGCMAPNADAATVPCDPLSLVDAPGVVSSAAYGTIGTGPQQSAAPCSRNCNAMPASRDQYRQYSLCVDQCPPREWSLVCIHRPSEIVLSIKQRKELLNVIWLSIMD